MLQPGTLAVTLIRSPIGRNAKHRACVTGLGLRRIRHTRVLENTASVRGMINKIRDMVQVEYAVEPGSHDAAESGG